MLALTLSGPQASRLAAIADVAGVGLERSTARRGARFSSRREVVTLAAGDAPTVLRALALVSSHLRDAGKAREADETLGVARLVEAAMAPRAEAA